MMCLTPTIPDWIRQYSHPMAYRPATAALIRTLQQRYLDRKEPECRIAAFRNITPSNSSTHQLLHTFNLGTNELPEPSTE